MQCWRLKMPRKISEITDGVFVTVRLSKEQRQMYYDIGGHDWLRNYLNRQIRSEEIQLGVSPQPKKLLIKNLGKYR